MYCFGVICTRLVVAKLHGLKDPHYCSPRPFIRMIKLKDFAVDLAKAGKGFKEIKTMIEQVYGIKMIVKTLLFDILKKV